MHLPRPTAVILAVLASVLPATGQTTSRDSRPPSLEIGPLTRATIAASANQDEPTPPGWMHVRQLAPGAEVVVTLKGGTPLIRGRFQSADDAGCMISDAYKGHQLIPRKVVAEVSVLTRHVRRHAWRGFLVGTAIVGVLVGVIVAEDPSDCATSAPACFFGAAAFSATFGGGIGAGIGALAGVNSEASTETIYRAP